MNIVKDSVAGIGEIKGSFVYVRMDENYLDCGIYLADGDEYDAPFLSDCNLIDTDNNGIVDFDLWSRSILDNESSINVAILSKKEVGEMIKRLQCIYNKMSDS